MSCPFTRKLGLGRIRFQAHTVGDRIPFPAGLSDQLAVVLMNLFNVVTLPKPAS